MTFLKYWWLNKARPDLRNEDGPSMIQGPAGGMKGQEP